MANNTSRGITYPTSGDAVSPLETVFATMATTTNTAMGNLDAVDIASGTLPIVRGGTGGSTQAAALAQLGALGFGKNAIINGAFDLWERATLSTSSSTAGYFADRWRYTITGGSGKAFTQSRQSFTVGSAPVAGQEGRFFYRVSVSSNGAGGYTSEVVDQPIEDVRSFANSQVTISFYAKTTSGTLSVTPRLIQNFGTGGAPSSDVTTPGSSVTLTTSWQRFTQTLTLPTIATRTIGTNNDSALILSLLLPNNTLYTMDLWGVQLESGAVATNFTRAGTTIAGELSLAQRYYYRISNTLSNSSVFGSGMLQTTSTAWVLIKPPVRMRRAPTALETAGGLQFVSTSGLTASSASFGSANEDNIYIQLAVTGTAGQGGLARFSGTAGTAFVGFSAEI